ncbi:MAG: hypothetical protein HN423_02605 [Alphaproteobacteria bacterium]|nr:hypothetical protein [Alphaproteobacteria bacterium]
MGMKMRHKVGIGWAALLLAPVLAAGETLQLAGLEPRNTKQIMDDCLDRELNRMETMRAVDHVLTQRRSGQDFETTYAKLWLPAD